MLFSILARPQRSTLPWPLDVIPHGGMDLEIKNIPCNVGLTSNYGPHLRWKDFGILRQQVFLLPWQNPNSTESAPGMTAETKSVFLPF